MPERNTLQNALLQIAAALEPLERAFDAGQAIQSFAELGIVANAGQVASLATTVQNLSASVAELLGNAVALSEAIEAENASDIVSVSAELIGLIATAVQRIDQLQNAVAGLGGIPASVTNEFAERLFNFLLVRVLEQARGVNEILELLGVLERTRNNQGSTDPNHPQHTVSTFHFGELGTWFESPQGALEAQYAWGTAGFDGLELLKRLERLMLALGAPAFFDETSPNPSLEVVLFQLRPRLDLAPRGISIAVRQDLNPGSIVTEFDDLKVEFDLEAKLPFGAELTIQPPAEFSFVVDNPAETISGSLELRVTADRSQAATKYLLIGEPDGSRLEVGSFGITLGGRVTGSGGSSTADFSIGGNVADGLVLISLEDADGFLGAIFGGVRLESQFDFAFGYASDQGLFFEGSSSLEIQLPLHLNLGPVEVSALTFSVGIEGSTFPVAVSADIKAALGPVVAVVENIGIQADVRLSDDRDGNAGPVDLDFGFKPPNGVGLSVDAGIVKGGGYLYFDFHKEEYAGALELVFSGFLTIKAIGLITTRLPDGSQGFSLLIIMSVEFGTPFQLGYGFTLNAVGGLLGLNRSVELELVAEGVRTGAVESIMFPHDVVANAPQIISDLREFFPPAQDHFLIGPMAKLGWGTPTLISASLGVIVEIPPGNIAIVGILKVALPDEDAALIVIQVNFIGALEVDKSRLWFFASLYESRVLFITLEGEMGLLIAWGDAANFVLSVGGFHPSFEPPPLPFPSPKRIAISILNETFARIRVEGYFAVTSNTVQFGASVEVFFGLDEFKIEGHLGFDALFQFSPFYFTIGISASLEVKVFGIGLFSVRMRGELEGTSPWHIEGEGSISLLFFDIDVPFSHTWGEDENTTLPPISIVPILEAELNKLDNWTAELPPAHALLVSLRAIEATEDLILHPVGVLKVNQRAIPLDLDLDKVGNQLPTDAKRLTLEVPDADVDKIGDSKESFATAQFKALSDSKKLSTPAYEKYNSGAELSVTGGQARSASAVKRVVRYEEIIIDNSFKGRLRRFVGFALQLFTHFLLGNAASRSSLSAATKIQKAPVAQKIRVTQASYVVASSVDNTLHSETAQFASQAEAEDFLRAATRGSPELADVLHVIPAAELEDAA